MLTAPMDQQQKLQQMLAALWQQHRSAIEERVDILSRACDALRQGNLTMADREEAQSAAHKLAGVLGTFGRTEGTDVARRMEILLADHGSLANRLADLSAALAALKRAISQTSKDN